jgi:hypothetical protein
MAEVASPMQPLPKNRAGRDVYHIHNAIGTLQKVFPQQFKYIHYANKLQQDPSS